MTEQTTPSELSFWRRYGVKLPEMLVARRGRMFRGSDGAALDGGDPLDVTDTGPRDVLLGLTCYGFLCVMLGLIIGRMVWGGV